jgi:hypothetical protein
VRCGKKRAQATKAASYRQPHPARRPLKPLPPELEEQIEALRSRYFEEQAAMLEEEAKYEIGERINREGNGRFSTPY